MGQPLSRRAPYDPNRPASAADHLQGKRLGTVRVAEISQAAQAMTPLDTYGEQRGEDTLKAILFEQRAPEDVLLKIRDEGHVSFVGKKTSDTPLNYLHKRVAPSARICDQQFMAAELYVNDHQALGRVGSNTGATIDHLLMAPTLTADDKADIAAGVQFMRAASECKSVNDTSSKMLAAAFRVRRLEQKLAGWEKAILQDFLIAERPVGAVASRWGIKPEQASLLVRMALWTLARVQEDMSREFQAWLAIERTSIGEARE